MSNDNCGASTADGTPCQNPAGENGRCWLPSHNPDGECDAGQPGRPREPPSKATQEQIASIIEAGGSIQEACRKAGVHREQFYRWMEYGADEEAGPFQEFRDRLTHARGEGEGQYRQALLEIAKRNDDAATLMTMLKQRYPDAWGDVDRGDQAGGGVQVVVDSAEEFEVDPETLELVDE